MQLAIMMADGCEEIEGLTVVDLVRRAGITIDMISITGSDSFTGSHGIEVKADKTIEIADLNSYDGIILPGGMPGTRNLAAHTGVCDAVKTANAAGKLIAAICAAPSVFGGLGLLEGKKATSYPGFEEEMPGCTYLTERVVVDGNIITSRGMGTAIEFGLAIIEYCMDKATADKLSKGIMFS